MDQRQINRARLGALGMAAVWGMAAQPAAAEPCAPWSERALLPSLPRAAERFPYGIAAGGVRHDRATIWAHPDRAGALIAEYSAGPACPVQRSAPFEATAETGLTARVQLTGLLPDRRYRYRVIPEAGAASAWGWLQTSPAEDRPFTVAFSADVSSRPGFYTLIDQLTEEPDPAWFLFLGDWPYADIRPAATTVARYRDKHKASRSDPRLRRLLRHLPIMGVWDDHEVHNNWDGTALLKHPARVAAAQQVWHEWFVVEAPAFQGEIFRRIPWGPGVDFFLLDTRSHRSPNKQADGPGKTMLGARQLQWLLEGLASSEASFKVVVTSVPLGYGTTGRDAWSAFKRERDVILGAIQALQLKGVVFLTADQHWFAAHDLPEGVVELQVGPLAQITREPDPFVPPNVLLQRPQLNYGLLRYTPGTPPTLEVEVRGERRALLYATSLTPGRGSLSVEAPDLWTSWTLRGVHTFLGTGPQRLPWAPAGRYAIQWRPLLPGGPSPPDAQAVLTPGGGLSFAPDALQLPIPTLSLPLEGEALGASWEPLELLRAKAPRPRERRGAATTAEPPPLVKARVCQKAKLGDGAAAVRFRAQRGARFALLLDVEGASQRLVIELDQRQGAVRLVEVRAGRREVLAEALDIALPIEHTAVLAVARQRGALAVILDGRVVLRQRGVPRRQGGLIGLAAAPGAPVTFDTLALFDAASIPAGLLPP